MQTKHPRMTTGFTLIELLVVIAIITVLMGILLPCLQGIRRRAGTAACQARLRQWGIAFKMYTDENRGRWMTCRPNPPPGVSAVLEIGAALWLRTTLPFWSGTVRGHNPEWESSEESTARGWRSNERGIAMCPMTGTNKEGCFMARVVSFDYKSVSGGPAQKRYAAVSYSFNEWLYSDQQPSQGISISIGGRPAGPLAWGTYDVKGAANVPVLGDGMRDGYMFHDEPPPAEEGGPTGKYRWTNCCISRHNGGINMLFMDWSVRKVGLKELWTLKWSRGFDTAGPWTMTGGVKGDAWPAWMRSFKDY